MREKELVSTGNARLGTRNGLWFRIVVWEQVREATGRTGELHATVLATRFFLFREHRSVSLQPLRVLSSLAFAEFRARAPAAHSVARETRSFRAKPSCDQCLDRSPKVSFQSRCMAQQSLCHARCCDFSASLSKVNGDDWTKTVSLRRILNVQCQGQARQRRRALAAPVEGNIC
jgi:hypothetical protein